LFNLETFGFRVPPAVALLNCIPIKEAETLPHIFLPKQGFFADFSDEENNNGREAWPKTMVH
jgi:hypothetical protein